MIKQIRKQIAALLDPINPQDLLKKYLPVSNVYGLDRGKSVDRWYIEKFMSENRNDIKGKTLEILDRDYTKKYGKGKVTFSHILDIDLNNRHADIYGDLRNLKNKIKSNTYDCIILTQVLQYIDEPVAALKECHRILKPGGVILATIPTICRVDCVAGDEGDYWRFTRAGSVQLFRKAFPKQNIEAKAQGNILTGMGFWVGLSQSDYNKEDFAHNDPNFPCLITVRAHK